jgi:hypothetical protein
VRVDPIAIGCESEKTKRRPDKIGAPFLCYSIC